MVSTHTYLPTFQISGSAAELGLGIVLVELLTDSLSHSSNPESGERRHGGKKADRGEHTYPTNLLPEATVSVGLMDAWP